MQAYISSKNDEAFGYYLLMFVAKNESVGPFFQIIPKDIFKRKDNVFYILILRRKFVEILVTEIIRIFHSGLSFMFCPLVLL